jgi:hypothetical protein
MGVEGVELRRGDVGATWRMEQRERAKIGANDVAVRGRIRDRDGGSLPPGLPDVVGRPVGLCTLPQIPERRLAVDGIVIGELRDEGGFRRSPALLQRGVDDDIAAEVGVLEAVDNRIAGELVGLVGEDLVEPLGNLAADVDDARRGSHVIVFGAVEHLDGTGIVGAGLAVDEPADLRLLSAGREREKRRQLRIRRDRAP